MTSSRRKRSVERRQKHRACPARIALPCRARVGDRPKTRLEPLPDSGGSAGAWSRGCASPGRWMLSRDPARFSRRASLNLSCFDVTNARPAGDAVSMRSVRSLARSRCTAELLEVLESAPMLAVTWSPTPVVITVPMRCFRKRVRERCPSTYDRERSTALRLCESRGSANELGGAARR